MEAETRKREQDMLRRCAETLKDYNIITYGQFGRIDDSIKNMSK